MKQKDIPGFEAYCADESGTIFSKSYHQTGMMKPLKEKNPDMNIVAIDYDSGASKVNQENRIKLMLANARANMAEKERENDIKAEPENEKTAPDD